MYFLSVVKLNNILLCAAGQIFIAKNLVAELVNYETYSQGGIAVGVKTGQLYIAKEDVSCYIYATKCLQLIIIIQSRRLPELKILKKGQ